MEMINPTEHLLGLELADGWKVIEKYEKSADGTGGNFSICYKVEKDDRIAFLKAFDMARAIRETGIRRMQMINMLSKIYLYEKDLLLLCLGNKMDKVVKILTADEIIPEENNPSRDFVPYLIFELAERTIRDHVIEVAEMLDNACLMRSLHNVAVGISQLHGAGIVHQDLKGSNVLLFNPVDGSSKVSDLGCATIDINPHPIDFGDIAGDPDYAPPEQKFRHISDKWDVRRIATDLYHLGSLISFYYTKSTMTSLYAKHLPEDYKFDVWTGTYEEALPILKMTFATILENIETELQRRFSEKEIAADITKLIKYLCDPDPTKRGHPDSHTTSRYSMERFISIFDRLANKFESKLM